MMRFRRLSSRQWLIVLHDLLVTAIALIGAFAARFEDDRLLTERLGWMPILLSGYLVLAAIVYYAFGVHEPKWRFTSLPELKRILGAVAVLTASLVALDYLLLSPPFYGTFFFGKITIALFAIFLMTFLCASRVAYRYYRDVRTQRRSAGGRGMPTLIMGNAAEAEMPLRAIESGAISNIWPVGLLSPAHSDQASTVRGIPVLGVFDDLESVVAMLHEDKVHLSRLILTGSALDPDRGVDSILLRAKRLGLTTSQLPALNETGRQLQLAPVAVEDLLLRPSIKIDYRRLENFVTGKSVVVTGGGGSIGAEIADRVVTFGAERLLIIENSEPALYGITQALDAKQSSTRVEGRLADVRDRERTFQLFKRFKPDIVFHAAALKHVPLLEQDWNEGIKTNVFGSINVADAAVDCGAAAMVMISTDKAIEPVSMLGASKRFAEMYCQALDDSFASGERGERARTRFISVRFGNVLASNGSVVPKFKAQIQAGGPITVTHPEMVRYFMTIREACDLVVSAASHALSNLQSDASVYVLNMGQPVKIADLAERMIRLSGLEPGRDIEIVYTGIRPGERLNEILFARDETTTEVGIDGIVAARPLSPSLQTMKGWQAALEQGIAREERSAVYAVLQEAVPLFRGPVA
jgi:O-antigen biosynthesis protein WbqV